MIITQKEIQKIFDYQDGKLYWKIRPHHSHIKIGNHAGYEHQSGYRRIKINNILYLEHRLIYLYHYGYIPKMLDHIDGVRNNRYGII